MDKIISVKPISITNAVVTKESIPQKDNIKNTIERFEKIFPKRPLKT